MTRNTRIVKYCSRFVFICGWILWLRPTALCVLCDRCGKSSSSSNAIKTRPGHRGSIPDRKYHSRHSHFHFPIPFLTLISSLPSASSATSADNFCLVAALLLQHSCDSWLNVLAHGRWPLCVMRLIRGCGIWVDQALISYSLIFRHNVLREMLSRLATSVWLPSIFSKALTMRSRSAS